MDFKTPVGLTNYDIEESDNSSSEWKMDTRDGFKQGHSNFRAASFSLFLPGFQRLNPEKSKGRLMVCAGGAVLWCVTGSIIRRILM